LPFLFFVLKLTGASHRKCLVPCLEWKEGPGVTSTARIAWRPDVARQRWSAVSVIASRSPITTLLKLCDLAFTRFTSPGRFLPTLLSFLWGPMSFLWPTHPIEILRNALRFDTSDRTLGTAQQ
jgi:hypothetical protein